jgi:hypothetical protein
MSIFGSIWMNNFDIVFDREKPQVIIYDIIRCSPPSRLLSEDKGDLQVNPSEDPYVLPEKRGGKKSHHSLSKVKGKHEKSLKRMGKGN